jgi:predicted peroxiredoxin
MAADDKIVIGQTHGSDDPEAVLIGYLLGVEALRAGKQVVMWLTKDGIYIATDGIPMRSRCRRALHQGPPRRIRGEGGRFFACPCASRPGP